MESDNFYRNFMVKLDFVVVSFTTFFSIKNAEKLRNFYIL